MDHSRIFPPTYGAGQSSTMKRHPNVTHVLIAGGETSLLQTDFGITPIKVAGGSVRVKNKVRVRFNLAAVD